MVAHPLIGKQSTMNGELTQLQSHYTKRASAHFLLPWEVDVGRIVFANTDAEEKVAKLARLMKRELSENRLLRATWELFENYKAFEQESNDLSDKEYNCELFPPKEFPDVFSRINNCLQYDNFWDLQADYYEAVHEVDNTDYQEGEDLDNEFADLKQQAEEVRNKLQEFKSDKTGLTGYNTDDLLNEVKEIEDWMEDLDARRKDYDMYVKRNDLLYFSVQPCYPTISAENFKSNTDIIYGGNQLNVMPQAVIPSQSIPNINQGINKNACFVQPNIHSNIHSNTYPNTHPNIWNKPQNIVNNDSTNIKISINKSKVADVNVIKRSSEVVHTYERDNRNVNKNQLLRDEMLEGGDFTAGKTSNIEIDKLLQAYLPASAVLRCDFMLSFDGRCVNRIKQSLESMECVYLPIFCFHHWIAGIVTKEGKSYTLHIFDSAPSPRVWEALHDTFATYWPDLTLLNWHITRQQYGSDDWSVYGAKYVCVVLEN